MKTENHGVQKRFLLKTVTALILIIVVAIVLLRHFGLKQERACEKLMLGISQEELILALGSPINQQEIEQGVWLLSFRANIVAAGPILAKVDSSTKKVVWLQCDYP